MNVSSSFSFETKGFATPEVPQRKRSDTSVIIKSDVVTSKSPRLIDKYLLSPFVLVLDVLQQSREKPAQRLIYLQLLNFTIYLFVTEEQNMLYFFMSRKFRDFDGSDFAIYIVVIKVAGIFGLLVAIPVMNKLAQLHESTMLLVVTSMTASSLFLSG